MNNEERAQLIAEISAAIHIRNTDVGLTADEERWVRQAIEAQAQAQAMRKAIIEKTLAGLVWAAVIGLGVLVMTFLKEHGYK
jgi:hypothetical protein